MLNQPFIYYSVDQKAKTPEYISVEHRREQSVPIVDANFSLTNGN
jgi:hypothetical protein